MATIGTLSLRPQLPPDPIAQILVLSLQAWLKPAESFWDSVTT